MMTMKFLSTNSKKIAEMAVARRWIAMDVSMTTQFLDLAKFAGTTCHVFVVLRKAGLHAEWAVPSGLGGCSACTNPALLDCR